MKAVFLKELSQGIAGMIELSLKVGEKVKSWEWFDDEMNVTYLESS